jgi:hypothetical protein
MILSRFILLETIMAKKVSQTMVWIYGRQGLEMCELVRQAPDATKIRHLDTDTIERFQTSHVYLTLADAKKKIKARLQNSVKEHTAVITQLQEQIKAVDEFRPGK